MVRVSERQRYDSTAHRVEQAKSNNAAMMDVLSSMKRINSVSDDPMGTTQSIRERAKLKEIQQYKKNIDFSKGFLERAETAIAGISESLMRAKELAINLSNATNDAKSREATSREIGEITQNVLSLANTAYAGRYVFSGFRTHTPPLTQEDLYLGDDGAIFLQVSQNDFRQINIQARDFFEANNQDRDSRHLGLIDSLNTLYDGLQQDDTAMIRQAMTDLDHHMEKASSYQATLGARFNALDQAENRLELNSDLTAGALSKIEDADMFTATSDFKRTESILQSTLLASNKLLQPSLLNFMQ